MNIEQQILAGLISNDTFARGVIPFLKEDYFAEASSKVIFNITKKFADKYNKYPNKQILEIELEQYPALSQDTYDDTFVAIQELEAESTDVEWLKDQTEKYCQERAILNALKESIKVQGDPKRENGEIAVLMKDALAVSFDSNVGHDIIDDAEARYDATHGSQSKIPFTLGSFNKATKGGVEKKTLNVLMAGCVHPDWTTVLAQYSIDGVQRETIITMRKLTELFDSKINIKVDTPNGFVEVIEWVDKGSYEEYVIVAKDLPPLHVNEDHLVMTSFGWETTGVLCKLTEFNTDPVHLKTVNGISPAQIRKTGNMIPIFDIILDSEDHSYFANGILSHNTNVGKSLMMCFFAAQHYLQGLNVLYITLEMAEERIGTRIDANILDMSLDDYDTMPKEWFMKKINAIKAKMPNKIKVKEYPNGSAHSGHFRHLIHELKIKQNFVPDVIYVDYINICASARAAKTAPKDQRVQSIAEELRALGQEFEVPIFSATQTNRAGFSDSDADLTNTADAWGIPLTADWFVVIIQPPELEALGHFLVKQEKSRYDDKGKMRQFIIGVDKSRMKLYDIDEQPYLAGNHSAPVNDTPIMDVGKMSKFFEGVL